MDGQKRGWTGRKGVHGQKGGRGEGGERAEEEVDGHKRGGRAEERVDGRKGVDGQKGWTGRRGVYGRETGSKPAEHMKCTTGLEKVERSLFKFECWQLRHLVDNENCLESSGQQ